jgi:hypothetical protein
MVGVTGEVIQDPGLKARLTACLRTDVTDVACGTPTPMRRYDWDFLPKQNSEPSVRMYIRLEATAGAAMT